MRIIEIEPLHNGAHRNQTGTFTRLPVGWAVIPDELPVPQTFPFVNITIEGDTVTAMEAVEVPEPEPLPQ